MPRETGSRSRFSGLIGKVLDRVFDARIIGPIGAALILAGFVPLFLQDRLVAEASDWPSVQGRIEAARVTSESRRQSSGRRTGVSRSRLHYFARVEYRYTVSGTIYVNDDIWVTGGGSYRSYEEAEAVVRAYPAGGPVQVFYSPADPRRSALRIEGRAGSNYGMIVVGLIFLGTALLMILSARRAARHVGVPPKG